MQQRTTPDLRLSDAFDIFMLDVQSRHLTLNTEKFYESTLSPFIAWCEKQSIEYLRDVTHIHLRTFLKELADCKLSSHTQHNYARALKTLTFFLFYVHDELLESSPFSKVKMPKLEQKILKSFTKAEIKRFVWHCLIVGPGQAKFKHQIPMIDRTFDGFDLSVKNGMQPVFFNN